MTEHHILSFGAGHNVRCFQCDERVDADQGYICIEPAPKGGTSWYCDECWDAYGSKLVRITSGETLPPPDGYEALDFALLDKTTKCVGRAGRPCVEGVSTRIRVEGEPVCALCWVDAVARGEIVMARPTSTYADGGVADVGNFDVAW